MIFLKVYISIIIYFSFIRMELEKVELSQAASIQFISHRNDRQVHWLCAGSFEGVLEGEERPPCPEKDWCLRLCRFKGGLLGADQSTNSQRKGGPLPPSNFQDQSHLLWLVPSTTSQNVFHALGGKKLPSRQCLPRQRRDLPPIAIAERGQCSTLPAVQEDLGVDILAKHEQRC